MKRIAVIGCGLGGAATTLMLQKTGFQVTAYEQASTFTRLGAGIHLTPNVIKALAWPDIVSRLVAIACKPSAFVSRDAFTGEVIAELPLGQMVAEQFGAPYLTVHRGDFHALMVDALQPGTLHFNKCLRSVSEDCHGVRLSFEDGSEAAADIVIGADGLSSVVRGMVCENSPPHFSGQVAFRALVDIDQLGEHRSYLNDLTKWWSDDRFIIAYYMSALRDQYYFVAGYPQETWPVGVRSLPAQREEMMERFADFHPAARHVLAASREVRKWPLYERPAETAWSKGRVVLLGDACHPMRPHMAQGAAMAIEDGAVLVRCLMAAGLENWSVAYELYQQARNERVKKVQGISSENSWMRTTPDPAWLFASDAWNDPLIGKRLLSNLSIG
ncbi:FAD-dependent monooxygenase [Halomonas janggokensis]|uniref:FAD-dependent monooxygenase n=1 Tax=Vreelandella janggokensis TaxID=370767 RepID=A0ABT4IWC3_9GAMM|nr:FAD-dependent monooxygenase [Halomonas janggokensis]MCZ0927984.1 FAD-dependent monooxygenase [Halomonas janggokensis]MCZ0930558.1 FAD-dependent monooxygenase [Halomonas janggokensis]